MSVELHDIDSTEGDNDEHAVPSDLLAIFVACDQSGMTQEEFKQVFGGKD